MTLIKPVSVKHDTLHGDSSQSQLYKITVLKCLQRELRRDSAPLAIKSVNEWRGGELPGWIRDVNQQSLVREFCAKQEIFNALNAL